MVKKNTFKHIKEVANKARYSDLIFDGHIDASNLSVEHIVHKVVNGEIEIKTLENGVIEFERRTSKIKKLVKKARKYDIILKGNICASRLSVEQIVLNVVKRNFDLKTIENDVIEFGRRKRKRGMWLITIVIALVAIITLIVMLGK